MREILYSLNQCNLDVPLTHFMLILVLNPFKTSQNQSLSKIFKTGNRNILNRKTHVLKSLFNKLAGLQLY